MKYFLQFNLTFLIFIVFTFSSLTAAKTGTFFDDFDGAYDTNIWSSVSGGSISTNCGSVTNDALYFSGSGTRSAATTSFVFNEVVVSFYLKIGSGSYPCEDADQSNGENIVLEYSTDGSTWNIVNTYLADDPSFTSFHKVTENIVGSGVPVQVRIRQLSHSGSNFDHWSIDNFQISNTPIPTMTEWAAIILGGLLAVAGGWFLWRRV